MGASVRPDPVADYLSATRQQGGAGDPVSEYLAAKEAAVTPHGASGEWGNLPTPPSNAAHLLNTFSAIPGVERLEALAAQGASHLMPGRFGGQPISYEQSLGALRSVTGEINPRTAAVERFLGTLATAPVLPKNPVAAGALLGGADQALAATPTSLLDRAKHTAVGTGVGAAFGYLFSHAIPQAEGIMRARGTATVGAQQIALDEARKKASQLAYGAAKAEADQAARQGQASGLAAKLAEPTIEPFATLARSVPKNANATDGRIAIEAYKLMSREQGGLLRRMAEQGYDANLDVQAQRIAAAKQDLMGEASQVMPSFPAAVAQHARMKGEEAAMQRGADVAQSVFSGRHIAGKKLAMKSAEAFARDARAMTAAEKRRAAQGILGRLKENPKLAHVPYTRVPIPLPSAAVRRTPGLLDLVGQGSAFPQAGSLGPLTAYGLLNALRGSP